jgi:pantoate--beta-alanine ligase
MDVVRTRSAFSAHLESVRAAGRRVGLVPTMGALHAGHGALIERAAEECDVVAVTIFVNPLQFNMAADLTNYPRTFEADLALCDAAGVAVVFAPAVEEMYPSWPEPPAVTVSVSGVSEPLEGASRPGHFDGVSTIVAALFGAAGPCRAYFGEKDFQQLCVVRQLAAALAPGVEVVGCPTVREDDGLALSSRNVRLGAEERKAALVLSRALARGQQALAAGVAPVEVDALMADVVATEPRARLHYACCVDPATMGAPEGPVVGQELRLVIAASFGEVRLIDNSAAFVGADLERRSVPLLAGAR